MGDFFGFAHTPQRNAGGHLFQRFGFHAAGHFGFDETRCNPCHANAITCQLLGPDHGQGGDAGLGGGVVGLADIAGAGDRGDIDDQSLALQLDHLGCDFPGTQEYPGEVDVDHRLPLVQGHLLDFAVAYFQQQAITQDAGVVDQAVEGAEVGGDLADHVGYLLLIGNVAYVGPGIATGALAGSNCFVEALPTQVDQRQPSTLTGEIFSHRPAQPLAAAGYDDYAVFQLHVATPFDYSGLSARKNATTFGNYEYPGTKYSHEKTRWRPGVWLLSRVETHLTHPI